PAASPAGRRGEAGAGRRLLDGGPGLDREGPERGHAAFEAGVHHVDLVLQPLRVPLELRLAGAHLGGVTLRVLARAVLLLLQGGLLPDHRLDRRHRVLAREALGLDLVGALGDGPRPAEGARALARRLVEPAPQLGPRAPA